MGSNSEGADRFQLIADLIKQRSTALKKKHQLLFSGAPASEIAPVRIILDELWSQIATLAEDGNRVAESPAVDATSEPVRSTEEAISAILEDRVRIRCTGKDCELRSGMWTASKFADTYVNELDCQLCGSKLAYGLKEVTDEMEN